MFAGVAWQARQKQSPSSLPNSSNPVSLHFLTQDEAYFSKAPQRFQGKNEKRQQDRKADAARAKQEEDAVFLEDREEWFQRNRPGEDEVVGGYVTTPGASDDEEDHPFSARRKAKKGGRTFNEYTQKFEPK